MAKKEGVSPGGYKPRNPLHPALAPYAQHIESGRLYPVGVRRSVGTYIKETWDRRDFIWRDSRAKVRTQNSRNRLGSFWLLAKPLVDALFFWLLFAVILKTDQGMENYTAYIIVGVLMFQYISRSITQNAAVMNQGKSMMRAFSFPRITVPISLGVREAISAVPLLAVILVAIMVIPPHALPTWSWLLLLPVFLLNAVFNFGLGLIIARYTYVVPDLSQVLSVVIRFLMYGSGVIFPIERFINHPLVLHIIQANPIYIVLDLYRQILIYGSFGDLYHWGSLAAWSFGLLIVGFFIFWRGEEVYGREFN